MSDDSEVAAEKNFLAFGREVVKEQVVCHLVLEALIVELDWLRPPFRRNRYRWPRLVTRATAEPTIIETGADGALHLVSPSAGSIRKISKN